MPRCSVELTSEWKDGWPPGQYTYACAVGLSKCKHMLNCYVSSQTAVLVSLLPSPYPTHLISQVFFTTSSPRTVNLEVPATPPKNLSSLSSAIKQVNMQIAIP